MMAVGLIGTECTEPSLKKNGQSETFWAVQCSRCLKENYTAPLMTGIPSFCVKKGGGKFFSDLVSDNRQSKSCDSLMSSTTMKPGPLFPRATRALGTQCIISLFHSQIAF